MNDNDSVSIPFPQGGSKVIYIRTDDGQIAVRSDLIAFFLRGNDSGAVDVQLTNGHVAQIGTVGDDAFKELALKWDGVLRNE